MMTFETNCVLCSGPQEVQALEDMMDEAEEIDHDTFLDEIGFEAYEQFSLEMGYNSVLRLSDDYHVSFYKSRFEGKRCVYCVHSAIEYIFT